MIKTLRAWFGGIPMWARGVSVSFGIFLFGLVVLNPAAGASTIYDTSIATMTGDVGGFGSAITGWVGDLLIIVLPLFALGLAWGLFRKFGKQIRAFFS